MVVVAWGAGGRGRGGVCYIRRRPDAIEIVIVVAVGAFIIVPTMVTGRADPPRPDRR